MANRTYRHLFAAQVIALVHGTGLTTIALSLLAYDLVGGNAGAVLGTALALKMIAYVSIAPVVGGLAHVLPRRRDFWSALDLARALIVLALPFVTSVWQVDLLIFLVNACSAAFTPLFQATIPDRPGRRGDLHARPVAQPFWPMISRPLLSPTAAALALLLVSYDALFMINAGAFRRLRAPRAVGGVAGPLDRPSAPGVCCQKIGFRHARLSEDAAPAWPCFAPLGAWGGCRPQGR